MVERRFHVMAQYTPPWWWVYPIRHYSSNPSIQHIQSSSKPSLQTVYILKLRDHTECAGRLGASCDCTRGCDGGRWWVYSNSSPLRFKSMYTVYIASKFNFHRINTLAIAKSYRIDAWTLLWNDCFHVIRTHSSGSYHRIQISSPPRLRPVCTDYPISRLRLPTVYRSTSSYSNM